MHHLTSYQLGIVYSLGSIVDSRWVFRHYNRYFLEQIHFCNSIYKQEYKGKTQYVLKMPLDVIDVSGYNYTNRNSDQRDIPILDSESDYREFVRAYVEIHGRLDIRNAISHGKRYKQLRLRIYGNYVMMESLSRLLNKYVDVGIKKVSEEAGNGKTGILYYQSRDEIEWVDRDDVVGGNKCEEYWDEIWEMVNKMNR